MSEHNFRVQFVRGDTAENDNYTGREGEISIDTELHQIRVHDGVTPGGYATLGMSALEDITTALNSLGDDVNSIQQQIDSGSVGGGGGSETVTLEIESWSGDNVIVPDGVTYSREYDSTSVRINHGKGKYPVGWFGLNREPSPMVGITPTTVRNVQVVNDNTVIVTGIGGFEKFDLTLIF